MNYYAPSNRLVLRRLLEPKQYTSIDFGERCRQASVRASMGSVGDCYDNAMAESFFATLECELIDRCRFQKPNKARMAVFEFIEGSYNQHRRHSAIGYVSPIQYESNMLRRRPCPSLNLSTECMDRRRDANGFGRCWSRAAPMYSASFIGRFFARAMMVSRAWRIQIAG